MQAPFKIESDSFPLTVLEAGRAEKHYWLDIWRYRELLYILAWRDLAVRYKQTVVGVAWAVVRPLLTMIVFTVIFGTIAKLPSDGSVPYSLLVLSGMLPWILFSVSLGDASNSLIANSNLISKVYFPRLIVPIASVMTALADFSVSLVIACLLFLYHRFVPSWHIVYLPLFAVMAVLASLGPGLFFAAMNVKYRDFRYVLPFFIQFGLYVSPVGFSSRVVDEQWRFVFGLNPMVGVIDGFRWSLLGSDCRIHWPSMLTSILVTLLMLWLGIRKFRAMERSFADII